MNLEKHFTKKIFFFANFVKGGAYTLIKKSSNSGQFLFSVENSIKYHQITKIKIFILNLVPFLIFHAVCKLNNLSHPLQDPLQCCLFNCPMLATLSVIRRFYGTASFTEKN